MTQSRWVSTYFSVAAAVAFVNWLALAPNLAFAQAHRVANRAAQSEFQSAPVPPDPHELVTGPVQVASTPADRLAALTLLRRAADNAISHRPKMDPFSFKVAFTATGNLTYTGSGELTEIWMSGQSWRVTESLGNYSLLRVGYSGQAADQQQVSLIPMRAQMLRNEVFWSTATAVNGAAPAQIRTSAAQWNGKPVTCILLSNAAGASAQTQGRLWEENEYCVASDSGLLQIHSIAPGTYTLFSYSKNLQFHGKSLADRITTYVAGAQVIDSDFSITDPGNVSPDLLTRTSQMIANGRSAMALSDPMRMALNVFGSTTSNTVQPVMVHAEIDSQGNVLDQEVSAAADPALAQAALQEVKKMKFGPSGISHAYINVRFMPQQQ